VGGIIRGNERPHLLAEGNFLGAERKIHVMTPFFALPLASPQAQSKLPEWRKQPGLAQAPLTPAI
jgi:hypothetical protein